MTSRSTILQNLQFLWETVALLMLELKVFVEKHREYHQSPQGNYTIATKFISPNPLKTKIHLRYIGYKDSVRRSQRTMRFLSLGK